MLHEKVTLKKLNALLKEITETYKECGNLKAGCTGCKWNRKVEEVLKRCKQHLQR